MADISPTPEDSISDAALISESANQPAATGLLEASYTCPFCGAVVVRIVGNTMQFMYSHIRQTDPNPDEQGNISLIFCHTVIDPGGMVVPPRDYVPLPALTQPYLNVQSSVMIPNPQQ